MCRHGGRIEWGSLTAIRQQSVQTYTAVVERCPCTGFYVGHVPDCPGAHSQGETLDELNDNLEEVINMLLEGSPDGHGGQCTDS